MKPAEVVAVSVGRLRDVGVPTETRVAVVRGRFGRGKPRAVGEVWRLGALCLADDGALFATGDVIVVTEPTHPNHRNALAVKRNETRSMLRRAGIPVGTTVVLDARSTSPPPSRRSSSRRTDSGCSGRRGARASRSRRT